MAESQQPEHGVGAGNSMADSQAAWLAGRAAEQPNFADSADQPTTATLAQPKFNMVQVGRWSKFVATAAEQPKATQPAAQQPRRGKVPPKAPPPELLDPSRAQYWCSSGSAGSGSKQRWQVLQAKPADSDDYRQQLSGVSSSELSSLQSDISRLSLDDVERLAAWLTTVINTKRLEKLEMLGLRFAQMDETEMTKYLTVLMTNPAPDRPGHESFRHRYAEQLQEAVRRLALPSDSGVPAASDVGGASGASAAAPRFKKSRYQPSTPPLLLARFQPTTPPHLLQALEVHEGVSPSRVP